MHRPKSRALGIALGGTALSALAVGLSGAVSASAASLDGGGYVAGWV
jgi:6-phosphogluconolactonase